MKKKKSIPEITFDQWLRLLEAVHETAKKVTFPDDVDMAALKHLVKATDVLLRHKKNCPAYVFVGGRPHCLIRIRRDCGKN